MSDLLVALLAVALLGGLGLAGLVALTVVPFVVTLQRAERRGLSTRRAGAVALVGSALGLGAAALLALSGRLVPAVLPLLLVATGPLAVAAAPRWLGRRGRHEPRG